ncbi:MAG TPA: hypothetical protein PK544_16710 [Spirochaetota bacterium]|nr:hypothetical protein [Spirochaetota bacterium]
MGPTYDCNPISMSRRCCSGFWRGTVRFAGRFICTGDRVSVKGKSVCFVKDPYSHVTYYPGGDVKGGEIDSNHPARFSSDMYDFSASGEVLFYPGGSPMIVHHANGHCMVSDKQKVQIFSHIILYESGRAKEFRSADKSRGFTVRGAGCIYRDIAAREFSFYMDGSIRSLSNIQKDYLFRSNGKDITVPARSDVVFRPSGEVFSVMYNVSGKNMPLFYGGEKIDLEPYQIHLNCSDFEKKKIESIGVNTSWLDNVVTIDTDPESRVFYPDFIWVKYSNIKKRTVRSIMCIEKTPVIFPGGRKHICEPFVWYDIGSDPVTK